MKKFTFKKFTKKSGSLIPFSLSNDVPFITKRIFLIYGKKNFIRGDHAHRKCKQFLVPIFGKMEVEYENKFKKFKNILDYKKKRGLLLKPKTWCKIKFRTNNCILMVFCDREYEFKDYIENYQSFLKIVKR
jgi:UDP-2-acetamido-3-amino-2,3-dideoxy-glucuronate N-acetyltransferase